MEIKEILQHRARDLDAVLRSNKKIKLARYIFIRSLYKIFSFNEEKLTSYIPSSESSLGSFKFFSRAKTLDFLFYSRYYEPQTTKYLQDNKGRTFIDIGSHIGRFAVIGSKSFKNVFAFEANPFNFKILKNNVLLNNLSNVFFTNLAVSDKKANLMLEMPSLNTGATKISSKGEIKTKAIKLDNFLKKKRLSPLDVDLVLIDVEGHEDKVLNGAKDFLSKTSAKLLIECFDFKKIEKILSQYGYKKKKVFDFYNYLFIKEQLSN